MNELRIGTARVRPRFNEIVRNGEVTRIPPKYMSVLLCLAERPGDVFSRDELLDRVWPDTVVVEASLTRAIHELRKVLETDPSEPVYIRTIPKRGYVLSGLRDSSEDEVNIAAPVGTGGSLTRSQGRVIWGAAAITALFALATTAVSKFDAQSAIPNAELADPRPLTAFQGDEFDPALSPDGKTVAFAWREREDDGANIFVKDIATGDLRQLTDSPAVERRPAWSPDGSRIALMQCDRSSGAIVLMDAEGGVPQTIAEISPSACGFGSGLSWSVDGDAIAFSDLVSNGAVGVHIVSIHSGDRRLVTEPGSPHGRDMIPVFSPNGDRLAFVRGSAQGQEIYQVSTNSDETRFVARAEFLIDGMDWSPDGRSLIFAANGNLWHVHSSGGTPELMVGSTSYDGQPSLARRGDRIAYASASLDVNIWHLPMGESVGPKASRIFASTRIDGDPAISPDGEQVAFISDRHGACGIWLSDRRESHLTELVSFQHDCMEMAMPRWSPDGRYLTYTAYSDGQTDVYTISVTNRVTQRLSNESSDEAAPNWSADGSQIYFSSNRTGKWELYRVPTSGGEAMAVGAGEAFFSAEDSAGRFLYFTRPATTGLFRVPVGGGATEVVLDHLDPLDDRNWRLAGDGLYFVSRTTESSPKMEYLDLASRERTRVADLAIDARECIRADVSPDGTWAVFARVDHGGRDLFVISGSAS